MQTLEHAYNGDPRPTLRATLLELHRDKRLSHRVTHGTTRKPSGSHERRQVQAKKAATPGMQHDVSQRQLEVGFREKEAVELAELTFRLA